MGKSGRLRTGSIIALAQYCQQISDPNCPKSRKNSSKPAGEMTSMISQGPQRFTPLRTSVVPITRD
jgi:hypothetical protein